MAAEYAPGTRLNGGRYRVLYEINRGGTAIVYAAVDTSVGKQVALKVMQPHGSKASVNLVAVKREPGTFAIPHSSSRAASFCDEQIQYASKALHPNIVALLDVFVEVERLIIVWELVAGSDLLDFLNEHGGRLPEPLAAHIFKQLITAVGYMHHNGFCHRDLKPENCMIERGSNLLKVIDFGLSKRLESAVTLGIGTPDYMSPELLNSSMLGGDQSLVMQSGTFSAAAADVWALGIILYLLVSGIYPFEDPEHAGDLLSTLRNVAQGRMQPLPRHVSLGCTSLVARALVRDPTCRITLQEIAADPWLCELSAKGRAVSLSTPLHTKPALPRWPAPSLRLNPRVHPAGASSSGDSAGDARKLTFSMQDVHMEHPARCAVIKGGGREEARVEPAKGVNVAQRFAGFKRLLRFSRHERKDSFDDMALGYGGV